MLISVGCASTSPSAEGTSSQAHLCRASTDAPDHPRAATGMVLPPTRRASHDLGSHRLSSHKPPSSTTPVCQPADTRRGIDFGVRSTTFVQYAADSSPKDERGSIEPCRIANVTDEAKVGQT